VREDQGAFRRKRWMRGRQRAKEKEATETFTFGQRRLPLSLQLFFFGRFRQFRSDVAFAAQIRETLASRGQGLERSGDRSFVGDRRIVFGQASSAKESSLLSHGPSSASRPTKRSQQ